VAWPGGDRGHLSCPSPRRRPPRPDPLPEGPDPHPPSLRDLPLLRRGVAGPEAQGEEADHGAGGLGAALGGQGCPRAPPVTRGGGPAGGAGGGAAAAGDVLGRAGVVGRQRPAPHLPPGPEGPHRGAAQGAPPPLAGPAPAAAPRRRALAAVTPPPQNTALGANGEKTGEEPGTWAF